MRDAGKKRRREEIEENREEEKMYQWMWRVQSCGCNPANRPLELTIVTFLLVPSLFPRSCRFVIRHEHTNTTQHNTHTRTHAHTTHNTHAHTTHNTHTHMHTRTHTYQHHNTHTRRDSDLSSSVQTLGYSISCVSMLLR